jgi:uncharacterized membrane protein
MSATPLRTAPLMLATLSMGLITGVFALYAHTIMPGLKHTDDRTFVTAFQSIDRAIINPWFIGGTFLGALVFTALAAFTNRGTPAFAWILAALVAYLVAVTITVTVHVPLNDAIKAAGDPAVANVARVRQQFHEARWTAWNIARVVTSGIGFVGLTWALLLHGRATQ